MILSLSIAKYMTFISQCFELCRTSGISLTERYACQLSMIVVALGAIGFIAEVFNALEYIKGNHIEDKADFDHFRHTTCTYKI